MPVFQDWLTEAVNLTFERLDRIVAALERIAAALERDRD